ncbi:hypothetical protein DSO57_1015311 [Entomophthora muscae]|uniref:Uncharacterized protein n=1 Tax=Entomophthora muscae TaxID=34485 RepID=A0ACC2TGF5_9FUNG|nr:hypothetical protein DSO57_1015311 [Entomophthora muscae]
MKLLIFCVLLVCSSLNHNLPQFCVVDLDFDGVIPQKCKTTLASDLEWTGSSFTQQLAEVAAKFTKTAEQLKASHGPFVNFYKITNLNQGFYFQPAIPLSMEYDCFRQEICTLDAGWRQNQGWAVSTSFDPTTRTPESPTMHELFSTPDSLQYQITFFGRSRISLWTKEVWWHTSYTLETIRLVGKYPESNFSHYSTVIPLFQDQTSPQLIFGYRNYPF